jgi:hypothetical protein
LYLLRKRCTDYGDRSSKVESRIVIPVVVGSSPIGHPKSRVFRAATQYSKRINTILEALGGNAYNFRRGLQITQEGGYSESVRADYDTRGWHSPLYYMPRAGRWTESRGWELSVLHHKLYLSNPPAGPVVTHAEATILGTRYDGPYRLAGVALVAGLGRRFYVAEATYVSLEAAMTAAYAKPQLGGTPAADLTVRNVALHGLLGLGFDF